MIIKPSLFSTLLLLFSLVFSSYASAAMHLPDDHYGPEFSISHSHSDHLHDVHVDSDHGHDLHLHLIGIVFDFIELFDSSLQSAAVEADSNFRKLHYSPPIPPPTT